MHYQINNYLIKSENAALSTIQTNSYILKYLSNLSPGLNVLDYGCGKCRYSKYLGEKAHSITLIDSEIQISRMQKIFGELTTVIEFAKLHINNSRVFSLEENDWKNSKYDFILCTNVLSAIPFINERYILLSNISELLSRDGTALITVQYRNSYFKSYNSKSTSKKFEDGWIVKKGNSYSFYGIILPKELIEMCNQCHLDVVDSVRLDGSIYLTVKSI